ncbi:MAG: uroporphyrinogen decarboxylase family protein [Anaerolineales bacterium]|jgi:uroporphyrinogen decarboxylase
MNSRHRLLTALNGKVPDRVPSSLGFYHQDYAQLAPPGAWRDDWVDIYFIAFRLSPEERKLARLAKPYGSDTRLGTVEQESTYRRWRYNPLSSDQRNPLSKAQSLSDLQRFPFPNLDQPHVDGWLAEQVADLHARGKAAGGNLPHLGGELFEAAWRLRGLANFLEDLLRRPEWAHFLLDRLTELACRNAHSLAQAGIDVLALDDDVGMPGSMMISPATWRDFFKPRMEAIIQSARRVNPEVKILFHSDGNFTPIIADLIEIGVDAINPLQPEHMHPLQIRKQFGPDLALWGTVGRQTTFSFSSPADIRQEVGERLETLGRAGLVLCPAYDIDEPDIPWANVEAFLKAVRELG